MTTITREALARLMGLPFTDEQWAAIAAPLEPGVVIAGAGSGKTSVMAARVVWLVANHGVAPEQVLGLTFTNKAAGELSTRVRRSLQAWASSGPQAHASGPSSLDVEPTVQTYHAYAARLLREHGLRLGIEPSVRLLADASRFQLADRVLRRVEGPFPAFDRSLATIVGDVLALDGELNEHLVSLDELTTFDVQLVTELSAVDQPTRDVAAVLSAARARLDLVRVVAEYRAEKRSRDLVDFGDQLAFAARLATTVPEVAVSERSTFRVVLLDEYQDTSIAQKQLLLGLFGDGHPVTAVGDPFQAIYGWRGASVSNIDRFPDEFLTAGGRAARRYQLGQNNRSGGHVLALANELAEPLREVHPGVSTLTPRDEVADKGQSVVGLFETYDDEVAWVADDIARRCADPDPSVASPGGIAVLVRVTSDIAAYHAALVDRGVPVQVVGLSGLLALPEVADVVATLNVLDDPTANPSLVRLLSGPRWRIGPRDLVLLGRRARELVAPPTLAERPGDVRDRDRALLDAVSGVDPTEVVSLVDAMADPGPAAFDPQALARFEAFTAELVTLRRHLGQPLDDVVHSVVSALGLSVEVGASTTDARAGDALASFLDVASSFVDLDADPSVRAFLAYLRAASRHDRGLDAALPTESDAVTLMTVHKAKGLEWSCVYLPNLTSGVFPSGRGRARWTTRPATLPFPLRGDAVDHPATPTWDNASLKTFASRCAELDSREELRLGYVAVTRARDTTVLTSHWWGPTQVNPRGASPYLVAAHAHVTANPTHGTVVSWIESPAHEANPALQSAAEYHWPAPLDESAFARRSAAADQVRAAAHGGPDLSIPSSLSVGDQEQLAEWDRDRVLLVDEIRRLNEPVRDVDIPASLTASQLVRLNSDPQGFARDIVRPLPRPPAPAARRGTEFHAWVEARFQRPALLDLDDLDAADSAPLDADLETLQSRFLAGPYADRVPLAVEAPFEVVIAGHPVRGRIDAVYGTTGRRGERRYEVVDWKTGSTSADPLQLAVYRVAWAELHSVPVDQVDAVFYAVVSGEVQRFEDLPDRSALSALLLRAAQ
ncbi:MAG: ATP-dependent DNA helicase [Actinomycetes bacterium]